MDVPKTGFFIHAGNCQVYMVAAAGQKGHDHRPVIKIRRSLFDILFIFLIVCQVREVVLYVFPVRDPVDIDEIRDPFKACCMESVVYEVLADVSSISERPERILEFLEKRVAT